MPRIESISVDGRSGRVAFLASISEGGQEIASTVVHLEATEVFGLISRLTLAQQKAFEVLDDAALREHEALVQARALPEGSEAP